MTIIGIDDTDSRTKGMCTTYVGHLIAEELRSLGATVTDVQLIRLNPAAKHKTRGNAAVAIHTTADSYTSLTIADSIVGENSAQEDPETNPGVIVTSEEPSDEVGQFTLDTIHTLRDISEAKSLIEQEGFKYSSYGNGRGLIGSLAAIGATKAIDDWTYEYISYREESEWGTNRSVDYEMLFDVADKYYPDVWDTVDRVQNDAVCIPHTPCPILFGIRGDSPEAVQELTADLEGHSEPVKTRQLFRTNQGTDIHLQNGSVTTVENGKAYQLEGIVAEEPYTIEGGHVYFTISDLETESDYLDVVAFEPTKHFKNTVRNLRVGDTLSVCGEVSQNTLKLEKFNIKSLDTTETVNPTCPDCGNSMSSAGSNAGYRCKNCSNHTDSKVEIEIERDLSEGWYEVPPCARRHIAKPLVRGGFEGETYPFK